MQKWLPYLIDSQRVTWRRTATATSPTPEQIAAHEVATSRAEWTLRLVKRMHDAGVRFLAGTDHPIPVMVPGASLHK